MLALLRSLAVVTIQRECIALSIEPKIFQSKDGLAWTLGPRKQPVLD